MARLSIFVVLLLATWALATSAAAAWMPWYVKVTSVYGVMHFETPNRNECQYQARRIMLDVDPPDRLATCQFYFFPPKGAIKL